MPIGSYCCVVLVSAASAQHGLELRAAKSVHSDSCPTSYIAALPPAEGEPSVQDTVRKHRRRQRVVKFAHVPTHVALATEPSYVLTFSYWDRTEPLETGLASAEAVRDLCCRGPPEIG